jgi:tetratricopeptide (TPR) repeat protein
MMAKKDFKRALNLFDRVIALDRINARAYYYRALCIKERGATDRPEQKLFRAAAGQLDHPEEFERDQVKGNLLASITVDPDLVDARLELAEMYILEKNLVKAKEQIEEIFKRRAPDLKIMTLLSGMYILEGKPEEAEKILKVIIDQKPYYTPAYIRLGFLYRHMGNAEKALESFQTAYTKDPRQIGLVKMMTDIHVAQKKYTAALDLVDTLAPSAGAGQAAFFENLRGEIFILKGNSDKAIEYFKRSIELKPNYIQPQMQVANVYYRQNHIAAALEQYKAVESIRPDYLPALIAMGYAYDTLGSSDQAETYYRKVLQINPKHPNAANNLAFILCERPDHLEEAFRLAKLARQSRPKDPNVMDTMGWTWYQKGNYLSARSELEESLKINPESALACYHYGMILYTMKKYEQARDYFKKALEIDPNFNGAATAKKMLN